MSLYQICMDDFKNNDTPIGMFRSVLKNTSLSYSQKDNAILVTNDNDGGSWELYSIPKRSSEEVDYCSQTKKGKGLSAVFIGVNKFAVLAKDKIIELYNVKTGINFKFK